MLLVVVCWCGCGCRCVAAAVVCGVCGCGVHLQKCGGGDDDGGGADVGVLSGVRVGVGVGVQSGCCDSSVDAVVAVGGRNVVAAQHSVAGTAVAVGGGVGAAVVVAGRVASSAGAERLAAACGSVSGCLGPSIRQGTGPVRE